VTRSFRASSRRSIGGRTSGSRLDPRLPDLLDRYLPGRISRDG
jgi:hypothetical protein